MDKDSVPDMAVSPTPLREQIEEKLREAIISGYFPPGTHLSDKRLSETFQVSRPVVREAVRLLAAEGLIETIPHRGSFVRTMSADEAERFYDLRGVLEALAASLFAKNATDAEIEVLASLYERLRAEGPDLTGTQRLDLKQQFYNVLIMGARNHNLETMLHQMLNTNVLLRGTSLSVPGRVRKTIEELGRLIEAIRRRDQDAAWAASLDHVNAAAATAISVLRAREAEKA